MTSENLNESELIAYHGRQLPKAEVQKQFNRDMAEVWWRPEKFNMNGQAVDFMGVIHAPETLENPRLFEEIKNAIEKAAIVVLELAPAAQGIFTDEYLERLFAGMTQIGMRFDRETVVDRLRHNPITDFFTKVESMAAEANKTVLTVDPNDSDPVAQSRLDRADDYVKLAKISAFLSFAAPGVRKLIKDHSDGINFKTTSRRKFLQRLGMGGLAISSLALAPDIEQLGFRQNGQERGRWATSFGPLLYDYLDYRDVAVAEGLDYVTKNYAEIVGPQAAGPVVPIYGSAHAKSVRHYCLEEDERQTKYQTYGLFRDEAPPVFRSYKYSAAGWKLEKEQKL